MNRAKQPEQANLPGERLRESQLLGNLKPNLNISQLVLDSKENVVLVEKGSWYLLWGREVSGKV